MLSIGSKAPDIKLRLDSGEIFRLRDLAGRKNAVITFYPHEFEKEESRATYLFLQQLQRISELGIIVIAIAPKNSDKLREFLSLYNFTIPVAPDPTLEVSRNYRAVWLRGLALRKLTYLIDKNGVIRGRLSNQLMLEKSWKRIMNLLETMNAE